VQRSAAVFLLGFVIAAGAQGATLAGHTIPANGKLDFQFPIEKYFRGYAAQGGNPVPTTGRALLFFPKDFAPAKTWPILIVTSTTDVDRTSPMDAPWYQDPANGEGWIVLATDATIRPRTDSTMWRMGILAAGLEVIRKDWPQSARWPVAFAGLSGGAKRSCVLSAMLARSGTVNICGIFLAGINNDRLSVAYHDYRPSPAFLNVPIWISSGMNDPIATPNLTTEAYNSMRRAGFDNVRLESFNGGHQLKRLHVRLALRWFRELGKF
jgi:pimeloyl-ACP methyl ester carboxylesterase